MPNQNSHSDESSNGELTEPDFEGELKKNRSVYISSPPKRRLRVIRQRLENPWLGATLLVIHVSAVEALARSLAMNAKARTKAKLKELYGEYQYKDPKSLVIEYLGSHGKTTTDVFSLDTWRKFEYAVCYRNMVIHECTLLGEDKFAHLTKACEVVVEKLAGLAGLSESENSSINVQRT